MSNIKVYTAQEFDCEILGEAKYKTVEYILKQDHDQAIAALNEKLRVAKEALEFYADRKNWSDMPASYHPECDMIYCMDYRFDEKAVAALKQLEQE